VVADEFCLILPPEALELAGETGFAVTSLNNWLPTLYRTVYHLPVASGVARGIADQCRAGCVSLSLPRPANVSGTKEVFS
jgi:hypothetical protein